ncbi:unnamed protein product [Cylicostephanus goldi]|uniref:Uncharacterized protein n=1 Tax=Cylicostephanus goldi TaxID=71465 RepID=A0A3P6UFC4_CYLGO|nr:unnamed protein product [Cylicostephanus goldi]
MHPKGRLDIATAVCFNAAIALKEPPPYEDEGLELNWEDDVDEGLESDLRTGTDTINNIVEHYFTQLVYYSF